MGRIGLGIAPHNPKVVYATIESTRKAGGFFVSKDGGASFKKVNDYSAPGAQYYGEIFVDPNDDDRIYSADVWIRVSDDKAGFVRGATPHPPKSSKPAA